MVLAGSTIDPAPAPVKGRRFQGEARGLWRRRIRGTAAEKQKPQAEDGLEGEDTGAAVAMEPCAREAPRNWTTKHEVAQGVSSAVLDVGVNVAPVVV